MSIYAVIGSDFTEVPRREMNGSAHKAFPLITCNSCFEARQDAVNDLIKRDTAKAIAQKVIADSTYECCPNCGKMLFSKHNFCEECGQRLDFENKAL